MLLAANATTAPTVRSTAPDGQSSQRSHGRSQRGQCSVPRYWCCMWYLLVAQPTRLPRGRFPRCTCLLWGRWANQRPICRQTDPVESRRIDAQHGRDRCSHTPPFYSVVHFPSPQAVHPSPSAAPWPLVDLAAGGPDEAVGLADDRLPRRRAVEARWSLLPPTARLHSTVRHLGPQHPSGGSSAGRRREWSRHAFRIFAGTSAGSPSRRIRAMCRTGCALILGATVSRACSPSWPCTSNHGWPPLHSTYTLHP